MTGYPWATGDALLADDLNAAFANGMGLAGGPFLPLSGGTVVGPDVVTINSSLQFGTSATYPPGAQPRNSIRLFSDNALSGTGVTGVGYVHLLQVNSDQVQYISGGTDGTSLLDISHNFGGGATRGWRNAQTITLTQTGATTNKAANVNPINVGLMINNAVQVADGGTGLQHGGHANATATPWNSTTGLGIQCTLYAAAAYQSGQLGMEIDVGGHAGSSALSKKGLLIAKWAYDSYQSPLDDAGLIIIDQPGAAYGWTSGIRFGSSAAQWPIDPNNGAIIGAVYSAPGGVVQAGARYGIDFSDVAFPAFSNTRTGGFLSSNNFAVDGVGAVMIGSTYLTPSSAGLAIDAKGLVSTGATVAAGGSGYSVGDVLYDPFGGMYRVATLSGTAVATVTLYADAKGNTHAANYPSATPPTNPIATSGWDFAANIAAGCTLNLTWNTTATTLALQPSGGAITTAGGLSFGTNVGASNTDLSKHIILNTAGYGIGITPQRINYSVGAGSAHVFLVSGTDSVTMTSGGGLKVLNGLGVWNTTPITTKPTGWGGATGTATRTTFVTSSVTLSVLAEHVKALIDDLTLYGLIGL